MIRDQKSPKMGDIIYGQPHTTKYKLKFYQSFQSFKRTLGNELLCAKSSLSDFDVEVSISLDFEVVLLM